jgi:inward rectifier potassium channel
MASHRTEDDQSRAARRRARAGEPDRKPRQRRRRDRDRDRDGNRRPTVFAFAPTRALGLQRALDKDFYHFMLQRTWLEFFALVGLAFFTTNALFALAYTIQPGDIANARPGSLEDAFYFSVQTLATIGYGGMYPVTRYAHITVAFEALTGIFGVALVTGITFTRFARPTARVLFADKVVLAPRNGVPYLMFRMANWRRNQVVEAQLRVVLLATERTREGETLRRQFDLPMVRDRTSVFYLSWTAMHAIDAQSPFHGPGALERLRAQGAELYLSLTGFDETIGQTIHARHGYTLDDIVTGARFADVLTTLPDGTREIDYRKFHDLVSVVDAPVEADGTAGTAPPEHPPAGDIQADASGPSGPR